VVHFVKGATVSSFKQSVSHWPISKLSEQDFKRVLEIGITGVEMPPKSDYQKFRDLGFTIATVGGHKSLEDGLNKKENHSRIADELRASLEDAKKFEIPNLICFSGNRNGKSEQEGAENTIEGLRLVAKDAEAAGVNLVVELLNSKVDHPDYQCDHTSWGVQVVKAVGSPRVKLLYDIYHMQIMEGDLIRNIRDNIEHIAHFHTAGNPGRKDLDDQQEIFYPAVARAIHETGYNGWLGHEFGPKGDPIAALQQAFDACNVS
jgi:hydroxypyruvate isomerase